MVSVASALNPTERRMRCVQVLCYRLTGNFTCAKAGQAVMQQLSTCFTWLTNLQFTFTAIRTFITRSKTKCAHRQRRWNQFPSVVRGACVRPSCLRRYLCGCERQHTDQLGRPKPQRGRCATPPHTSQRGDFLLVVNLLLRN